MTDPTSARVEVERPNKAWHDLVTALRGENQALRERAEAAEAERDRQYDENVHRIAMQARAENERDAARRAEAAAWNDAIEAAARDVEEWGNSFGDIDPVQPRVVADDIRDLRRAAPTEDR